MRYMAGKTLEMIGLLVVLAALLAGLGLTPSGQASMGQELFLLGIGGMVFMVGWFLEQGAKSH